MIRLYFIFLFWLSAALCTAQNIPINTWRSHMPYLNGLCVVEAGNKIYCGTNTGLFYFDRSDNSVHTLSKTDGFSDVFIQTLAYDKIHDMLFVAYQNGNMDLLHAGKITNLSTFKDNSLLIKSIYIYGDTAYISHTAGLSYFQIQENQVNVTFNCFGLNGANRVARQDKYIYTCSDSGVKRTIYNTFLINDCSIWTVTSQDSCGSVVSFAGRLYGAFKDGYLRVFDTVSNTWLAVHHNKWNRHIQSLEAGNGRLIMATNDSIYTFDPDLKYTSFSSPQQNDVILDNEQNLWIAKDNYALLNVNSSGTYFHQPGGKPATTVGITAYGYHNEIWVSTGLFKSDGAPSYNNYGFYMFDGTNWYNYNQNTLPGHPDIRDYMGMTKDSINNHLWLASVDSGLVDFNPVDQSIKVYNNGNTAKALPSAGDHFSNKTPVSDVTFDKNGVLWAGLYRPNPDKNLQLVSRKRDGTINSYSKGSQTQVNKVLVDDYGYIWLIDSRDNNGVFIYDPVHNKTAVLTTTQGEGNLPAGNVYSIAKDKGGQIWFGTSAGVGVYSDPGLLFGNKKYDVQRPYISNGVNSGYLLAAQSINCIAVDGANRKWFGTNDGAYLFNADGDKEIFHFNTLNSPLISNQINAIAINSVTGEVFFITDKGIVSYRASATDGGQHNGDVYAFPNPVKPGYTGPIAITGLVNNANVKITDITGTLVFETTAQGGQAIWYGKNFSGQPANSGVYLALITNTDGTETKIVKIMIIR